MSSKDVSAVKPSKVARLASKLCADHKDFHLTRSLRPMSERKLKRAAA